MTGKVGRDKVHIHVVSDVLSLKCICMLYTSIAVKKASGDSSVQWKAWGIPSMFVASVRLWRLNGRFRLAV